MPLHGDIGKLLDTSYLIAQRGDIEGMAPGQPRIIAFERLEQRRFDVAAVQRSRMPKFQELSQSTQR